MCNLAVSSSFVRVDPDDNSSAEMSDGVYTARAPSPATLPFGKIFASVRCPIMFFVSTSCSKLCDALRFPSKVQVVLCSISLMAEDFPAFIFCSVHSSLLDFLLFFLVKFFCERVVPHTQPTLALRLLHPPGASRRTFLRNRCETRT